MFITFVMELHSNTKNFKNLTNLIPHQDDHQLSAEWHFFLPQTQMFTNSIKFSKKTITI